jgi:RNA polymerase sigma-70 factor (ECF subfamily)
VTDETQWIRLAREGDQEAFGHLVLAYQTPVYNLAYRMLGNAAEAEEAAQETFLRTHTHLQRYDLQRPFRSWLFSIASHYCIDRLRRRRITWLPLEEDGAASPERLASDSPNPEAVLAQREREERIQQLLATLSPIDRAAITLRYWYDYSYEEIAETLNLTVSAIKSRLHRARRSLAKMMERSVLQEGESACAL